MRTLLLATALLFATAGAAQAQPFDARRCNAIRDVDVPYDLAAVGPSIVLTRGADRITVTDRAIVTAAGRLDDPALASRYAASLRGFMANARRVPILGARFGRAVAADNHRAESPGFLGALKDMCQSLLDVHEVQARITRALPAFTPPIRVTLAN